MNSPVRVGLTALSLLAAFGRWLLVQSRSITVQPGEAIQEAIDRTTDCSVMCLEEGAWEHLGIGRVLTVRGAEGGTP